MTCKRLFLILFLALPLSSCSDFLKGKPASESKVVELKQETVSCLKNVSLDMQKFMRSESTNEDIEKTFACIDDTLKQFQTRVEGRSEASAFNADELYEIFEKFIHDSSISKQATSDLLVLKAAVLGGSSQKITKEEISAMREYLIVLKGEAKNLLPFAQLFAFKKSDTVFSRSAIKNGFAQLNLSMKNLFKASKMARSNYRFEDFKALIVNLKIVDEDQQEVLSIADKVNDLLGGHVTVTSDDDYLVYIDNLTEVLRLYAVQVQGYVRFEISGPAQLNDTLDHLQSLVALLENSLQYRKTKLIAIETLDPLFTDILKQGLLPVNLSVDTALSFYKTMMVRLFENGQQGDVIAFKGIQRVHLENLKREIAVYRLYTRFLEKSFTVQAMELKTLQQLLVSYDFSKESDILQGFDRDTQALILRIMQEFKAEFAGKAPVLFHGKKMMIASNQEVWSQSWADMARGFYLKMLARVLMLGWGEVPLAKEMRQTFLTEKGLIKWSDEFRNFGIETKSVDPRSKNAGAVTLVSANLFSRSGNGDKKMDFNETVYYLGMLISGGAAGADEIQAGFEKNRCSRSEIDVFGRPWMDERCAYGDLRRSYRQYFSALPHLVAYLDRLDDARFKSFYASLMEVVRTDSANRGVRLETADIRGLAVLLHYIEAIYVTYDTDHNGTLSPAEIRASFPRFKSFAEDYAHKTAQASIDKFNSTTGRIAFFCFTEADLIRESFVYMVYKGKAPDEADLNKSACYHGGVTMSGIIPVPYRYNGDLITFKGEVDRSAVISTFKIIKDVLGSN